MRTLRAACVVGWVVALLGCEGLARGPGGGAADASIGGGVGVASGQGGGGSEPGQGDGGTSAGGGGGSGGGGGATTQGVHYLGRFDLSQPGTARFEWSGSGVVARFQGTGIAAALSLDATDFELVIDHGSPSVVSYDGNPATVTLASGLAPGQHTVELYRRDEALWGTSGFGGFTVTGGALVASAPPFSRKIEFIGDSIFAGYGNEGCPFSVGTQNEYLSVGAITARALSAEHITLAWSGIGMSISYDGKTTDQMPVRYERTLPTQSSSAWDFSQWIPDVVVIDLGDNDFTNRDPAQFVATYLDFLVKLRGRYPYAYVL